MESHGLTALSHINMQQGFHGLPQLPASYLTQYLYYLLQCSCHCYLQNSPDREILHMTRNNIHWSISFQVTQLTSSNMSRWDLNLQDAIALVTCFKVRMVRCRTRPDDVFASYALQANPKQKLISPGLSIDP